MTVERELSIQKRLGERLRELREREGLRQSDLARHAGVTQQQIRKYELGEDAIPARLMLFLAHALHVSIGSLYGEPPDALDARAHENPKVREFVAEYERIRSPARREKMRELVHVLALHLPD